MATIRARAIRKHTRRTTEPTAVPTGTYRPRSVIVSDSLQLINEALSRARMRLPQDTTSEAYRPARLTAARLRREQSRLSGDTI
jgi:hypothetical protein